MFGRRKEKESEKNTKKVIDDLCVMDLNLDESGNIKKQEEQEMEVEVVDKETEVDTVVNEEEGILRQLCHKTKTEYAGADMTEYSMDIPYKTVDAISTAVKGIDIKDLKMTAKKTQFFINNKLKNHISNKNKNGVLDIVSEVVSEEETNKHEVRVTVSVNIPVHPFQEEEPTENNWMVVEMSTNVKATFSTENSDLEELMDDVKNICIIAAKSVITRSTDSVIAKSLRVMLPNIIPEGILDTPKISSKSVRYSVESYSTLDMSIENIISGFDESEIIRSINKGVRHHG